MLTDHTLSASALERALVCIPSIALPGVRQVGGRDATRGQALHAYVQALMEGVPRELALVAVPDEHREAAEAIDLSRFPITVGAYAAEVAYSYNPETGTARELCRGKPRAEAYKDLPEGLVPGMADLVGVAEDAVLVGDWKFGFNAREVTPAATNPQLRFLAMCAAKVHGKARAFVFLLRQPEGGRPDFDVAELDVLDLDQGEAEVRQLLEDAEQERERVEVYDQAPRYVEGEHCTYCPHFSRCGAKTGHMLALLQQDPAQPLVLDGAVAPHLWARARAAAKVAEQMLEALKGYAAAEPFTLEDGKVVGPVPKEERTFDVTLATAALAAEYDPELAMGCVKRVDEFQVGKFEDALGAYLKRHPELDLTKKALVEQAEEVLAKAGAVRVTVKQVVREYRPAKAPAAPKEPSAPKEKKPRAKKAKELVAEQGGTPPADAPAEAPPDEGLGLPIAGLVPRTSSPAEAEALATMAAQRQQIQTAAEARAERIAELGAAVPEESLGLLEAPPRAVPLERPADVPADYVLVRCSECDEPLGWRPPGSSINPVLCPSKAAHLTPADPAEECPF